MARDADDDLSPLDWALRYAAVGWPIFPCRPTDKKPLTKHGFKDATTDPAQIRRWWATSPRALIGAPTGEAIDSWVLDVDCGVDKKTGRVKVGRESLAELGFTPEGLAEITPVARSGGGGYHAYFRWDPATPVRDSAGKIAISAGKVAANIDVRGAGGFIILAGSRSVDGPYSWLSPPRPDFQPAPAPAALLRAAIEANAKTRARAEPKTEPHADPAPQHAPKAGTTAYGARALAGEAAKVASTPAGQRNDELNRSAYKVGQLVAGGEIDQDEAAAVLIAAAEASGVVDDDGLPATEATVASGLTAGKEKPRETRKSRTSNLGKTQTTRLINLALRDASLFHEPGGEAFADVRIGGHREPMKIRSPKFSRWLTGRYYREFKGAPTPAAMQAARAVIEAEAIYAEGAEQMTHVRVAELNGKLYLDLGRPDWATVEIDGDGWRLINPSPVRFRRARGMLPLPVPIIGGDKSIRDLLRPFLNVSDDGLTLIIAWLAATLRPAPFPVIVLQGEQDAGKTSVTKVLKRIIDPNVAALRPLPRNDHDAAIAANNGHVLAYDNVSGIPQGASDTLCRIATGGGWAGRKYYTDEDETLFPDATKPIIVGGIGTVADRPDLIDRSVILALQPIPEAKRKPETTFEAEFEAAHPAILGALLDVVSMGLRRLPGVKLERTPRMADFAAFGTACEPAFAETGAFLSAYMENRERAAKNVLNDPVVAWVLRLLEGKTELTGNSTTLLEMLEERAPWPTIHSRSWPAGPNVLSSRLTLAAPGLRRLGVLYEGGREGHDRDRIKTIRTADGQPYVLPPELVKDEAM